jgi:hypothetical protein
LGCPLLCLPGPALAVDDTNPVGATIPSWTGTAASGDFTNQGTVTGDVDLSQGGRDTMTNTGSVGGNVPLSGGNGYVGNSGNALLITGNTGGQGNTYVYDSGVSAAPASRGAACSSAYKASDLLPRIFRLY